jgi:hypothetical protein
LATTKFCWVSSLPNATRPRPPRTPTASASRRAASST